MFALFENLFSGEPAQRFNKERVGVGKNCVSFRSTSMEMYNNTRRQCLESDNKCVLCEKTISYEGDRIVAYQNESVCYPCWKKQNYINISERVFLFIEYLPGDLIRIIKEWMLHEEWELCDRFDKVPTSLCCHILPSYKQIPTLMLPNYVSVDTETTKATFSWYPLEQKTGFFFILTTTEDVYDLFGIATKSRSIIRIDSMTTVSEDNFRRTFSKMNEIQKVSPDCFENFDALKQKYQQKNL